MIKLKGKPRLTDCQYHAALWRLTSIIKIRTIRRTNRFYYVWYGAMIKVQKSERFEMRLDEDTINRVDKWRSEQRDLPSRAEAMRRLVEAGLSRASSDSIRLSDGEKLLTLMLGDIYKHLEIKDGNIDPDFMAEVISRGHYWAPKWDMQGLFHDHEDDPRDVSFVVDVLDMWDFVEWSYEELSDKDKAKVEKDAAPFGKKVKFYGFDGNNETNLMSIARFFVEKMNRFSRFKKREMNSHSPSREVYQRMLSVFEPMRKDLIGHGLNADQLIKILNAKKWPGNE